MEPISDILLIVKHPQGAGCMAQITPVNNYSHLDIYFTPSGSAVPMMEVDRWCLWHGYALVAM